MGTDIVAAMNISGTLFNLMFIFALSIGSAVSIMIGNSLGADQFDQAKEYAKKGLRAAFICGIIVAGLMFILRDSILSLYSIKPDVLAHARTITNWITIIIPINCVEFTLFIGILRAGGDTKFCTLIDIGALWLAGLPLAVLGAFVFHLPLVFVYLLARTESFTRVILCYIRYRSNKWLNNVT
jgi:Na+-driven multidrug efflux pump